MGPRTVAALKAYQSAHKIKPTGHPDAATMKSLGG
jgi:peptidoglycan hydrolase-like protein with peptidoglycan-binding domain